VECQEQEETPIVHRHLLLAFLLALCGCAGLWSNRLTLPNQNTLVREQLVIHSDFPLAAHHRLFEELTAQRSDICRQLELPSSDEPIHVYLFEGQERFETFIRLHHPEFPNRRAFFLETDSRLSVYAQWGDRMADDLRHEVTHAYLHAVVPDIPLWLDEGLAKYYEVSRSQHGLNRQLFERLLAQIQQQSWQPNLRRLEQFAPTQDMTQDDYAEAWAWVHFLLEPAAARAGLLRSYLVDLRRDNATNPISLRLAGVIDQPNTALLEHVRGLADAGS
jgi:hypothetical protein